MNMTSYFKSAFFSLISVRRNTSEPAWLATSYVSLANYKVADTHGSQFNETFLLMFLQCSWGKYMHVSKNMVHTQLSRIGDTKLAGS